MPPTSILAHCRAALGVFSSDATNQNLHIFFPGHIRGEYSDCISGITRIKTNPATGMQRMKRFFLAAYVCKSKGGHFTSYQLHFPQRFHLVD